MAFEADIEGMNRRHLNAKVGLLILGAASAAEAQEQK
jgi:hypothetical protein